MSKADDFIRDLRHFYGGHSHREAAPMLVDIGRLRAFLESLAPGKVAVFCDHGFLEGQGCVKCRAADREDVKP
jgi:hypothetical protein